METITVEAFVDLPEVSRGRIARLPLTGRIEGLIARGMLRVVAGTSFEEEATAPDAEPDTEPTPDLDEIGDLTVPELRALVESAGIVLPGYVRKADLLGMLTETPSEAASDGETLVVDLADPDYFVDAQSASEDV